MGHKIKGPAELLANCFSKPEWEYLKHHKDFKIELEKGCKTVDDFERLSILGQQLLADWEIAHPEQPTFPGIAPRSRKRN